MSHELAPVQAQRPEIVNKANIAIATLAATVGFTAIKANTASAAPSEEYCASAATVFKSKDGEDVPPFSSYNYAFVDNGVAANINFSGNASLEGCQQNAQYTAGLVVTDSDSRREAATGVLTFTDDTVPAATRTQVAPKAKPGDVYELKVTAKYGATERTYFTAPSTYTETSSPIAPTVPGTPSNPSNPGNPNTPPAGQGDLTEEQCANLVFNSVSPSTKKSAPYYATNFSFKGKKATFKASNITDLEKLGCADDMKSTVYMQKTSGKGKTFRTVSKKSASFDDDKSSVSKNFTLKKTVKAGEKLRPVVKVQYGDRAKTIKLPSATARKK